MRIGFLGFLFLGALGLSGCTAEVGSERWCGQMDETPKGDWTANDAADYARHCLISNDKE